MNTIDPALQTADEENDSNAATEPPMTLERHVRTPILFRDPRKVLGGASIIVILLGLSFQYWSFPVIQKATTITVDTGVLRLVVYNFIFNSMAVGMFGMPYWPIIMQAACFLFTCGIAIWVPSLSIWFDQLTLVLMLSVLTIEFFYRRYWRR